MIAGRGGECDATCYVSIATLCLLRPSVFRHALEAVGLANQTDPTQPVYLIRFETDRQLPLRHGIETRPGQLGGW